MWRRISAILVSILLLVVPTVAATNQTATPAGNPTDAAYQDAVTTAASPASYEQAATLFIAIGAPIAFIMGGLLLFLLFVAGIASYWKEDRFWGVYFLTLFAALLLLIALPSLWMYF